MNLTLKKAIQYYKNDNSSSALLMLSSPELKCETEGDIISYLMLKSDLLMDDGKYNDAIILLKGCVILIHYSDRCHQILSTVYNNIGYSFEMLGEYDCSLDYYLSAFDVDEKNWSALRNLASVCKRHIANQVAASILERSVLNGNKDIDIRIGLICALVKMDELGKSYCYLRDLATEYPNHPFVKKSLKTIYETYEV
jgi:tetratricopeptide (TPR) repeat protein